MKWVSIAVSLFNQFRGKATATVTSDKAKQLRTRLLWEIVAVLLTFGVGYLVSHYTNKNTLQACQDERAELLRQNSRNQSILDSLHFAAQIAQKDQQILQKDETILLLNQRLRSDSIAHLTELQAMRAVNARIRNRQP